MFRSSGWTIVKNRYSQGTINKAARLYVEEGLNPGEIARRLGRVSRQTVSRWAKEYGWAREVEEHSSGEADLEELLARIKIKLARLVFGADGQEISEDLNPQQIYALCRVVAVLSPPAAVLLRKLDRAESESQGATVEERMSKVVELLQGAGFGPEAESGS